MLPYLVQIGDFRIASYPAFYGLGLTISGFVFVLLLVQRGSPIPKAAHAVLVLSLAAVAGGCAMFAIVRSAELGPQPWAILSLTGGGQILYGSVMLIPLVAWAFARLMSLPVSDTLDALAVASPLGLAVGRVGCLCRGCCHGGVAGGWVAIVFPKCIDNDGAVVGSPAFVFQLGHGLIGVTANESLPVHPVQIYEAVGCLVLFVAVWVAWRRGTLRGRLCCVLIPAYACMRFVLDFLRVQEEVLLGLTLAQVVSLVLCAVCLVMLLVARHAAEHKAVSLRTPASRNNQRRCHREGDLH